MTNRYRILMLIILLILTQTVFANSGNLSVNSFSIKYGLWALLLGIFSAISLPLGSIVGLTWKPSPKVTAIFTAFGGGALLAALSIELVAPTVMMVVGQIPSEAKIGNSGHSAVEMLSLITGCLIGGLFFFGLNELLNTHGGYLRKISTTITHFNRQRREKYRYLFRKLSRIEIFNRIPHEQIQNLIHYLEILHFKPGDIIFSEGDMPAGLYFINHGEIELYMAGKCVRKLKQGEFIGEISLLYHLPSKVTAIAKTKVSAFELMNEDFDKIRNKVPEIENLATQFATKEMNEESHFIEQNHIIESVKWNQHAIQHLHHSSDIPTHHEIMEEVKGNESAPLAMWLGNLLDSIPDSFILGSGFMLVLSSKLFNGEPGFSEIIPYTLIAGLFLSNFPEAMSSSIGMRKMGWKPIKIVSLWISLMIITALGAVLGYYFSNSISETITIGMEGIAAGAMLTMIAQTMIPEAVHIGGHRVVGLGTLAGYLSAVAFKIFEI